MGNFAFNSGNAFNNSNNANHNNQQQGWEKSVAFLNLYVPTVGGGKRKIGKLSLKASVKSDMEIINALQADPTAINRLASKLVLDFQLADAAENPENKLDF